MNEASIFQYIMNTFASVETAENYGYTFFFYKDDHLLPFATIASSDNEYESISNLNRPGVFRLNVGVSRETFRSLFGPGPVELGAHDFTSLDMIMPHPDYSAQHFICVLNPSETTFAALKPMLAEAHAIAATRHAKKANAGKPGS